MRVYAISDLHLSFSQDKPMDIFGENWKNYIVEIKQDWDEKVCQNDVVLVGGDISWAMTLENAKPDLDFLASLKGRIVMCRGNHDYWWNGISKVRAVLPKNVFAVQNDVVRLENLLVCGSRGWTVPDNGFKTEHDKKLYLREVLRIEMSLIEMDKQRRPNDEVVFLTHFPPFNIRKEQNEIINLFEKYEVKKVVYGHLHGKNAKVNLSFSRNGIEYILTSCDAVKNKLTNIV